MKVASLSDKGSIERSENRAFIRALVGEAGYFHLKVRAMWNPGYIFTTSKLCTLWNYFSPICFPKSLKFSICLPQKNAFWLRYGFLPKKPESCDAVLSGKNVRFLLPDPCQGRGGGGRISAFSDPVKNPKNVHLQKKRFLTFFLTPFHV